MIPKLTFVTTLAFAFTLSGSFAEKAADLKPTLAKPGKLIAEESFEATALGKDWSAAKGEWQPREGALFGREKKEDKHAAVLTLGKPNRDSIIRFAFKLDGAKSFALSLNSAKGGHLFRVSVTSGGVSINKDKDKKDPKSKAYALGKAAANFADGKWHTLLVEMKGAEVAVQTDHGTKVTGSDPALDVDKTGYRFIIQGESLIVDDVQVWEAL